MNDNCLFPGSERCGAINTYTKHKCRGDECRATSAERKRRHRNGTEPISDLNQLIEQLAPAGNWIDQAACRHTRNRIFFPERGETATTAKTICATCPVTQPCLEYALANNERHGIWGGLCDKERMTIRRQRSAAA